MIANADLALAEALQAQMVTLSARFIIRTNLDAFNPALDVVQSMVVLITSAALRESLFTQAVNRAIQEVLRGRPAYALLLVTLDNVQVAQLPEEWQSMPIVRGSYSRTSEPKVNIGIAQALGLAPGIAPYLTNTVETSLFQGKIYRRHGRNADALDMFAAMTQQFPTSFTAWFNVASSWGWMPERKTAAIAAFKRALDIEPTCITAWLWLSGLYKEVGEPDGARETKQHALELDATQSRLSWETKASILTWDLQRYREALVAYEHVKKQYPDEVFMFDDIAFCYLELKEYADAVTAYDHYLLQFHDDADALYNKAVALDELGQYSEALSAVTASVHAYLAEIEGEKTYIAECSASYSKGAAEIVGASDSLSRAFVELARLKHNLADAYFLDRDLSTE